MFELKIETVMLFKLQDLGKFTSLLIAKEIIFDKTPVISEARLNEEVVHWLASMNIKILGSFFVNEQYKSFPHGLIRFKNEQDALLFKMKWL